MGELMNAFSSTAARARIGVFCALAAGILFLQGTPLARAADNWPKLRPGLFQERAIAEDGDQLIALEAPVRAEDAAVVPIAIRARVDQTRERYVKAMYLVIDKNPAPLAAVFRLTPEVGRADIETRVRVEEYSNIRVVVEMNDGSLHMASRYVKASGGCSAPAGKDPSAAQANVGKMKLALEQSGPLNQPQLAQLMIRHPNDSGMAMDQVTRLYAPPYFVKHIEVAYEGKPILSAETDISISENPNFRFYFVPGKAGTLTAQVVDSKDLTYTAKLAVRGN
jgi:sulfur-oxidizing protein SoxY